MADLPNPATLEIVQNYDSFPRPFEDETFILSAEVTGLDDAVISDYNWSFRDQFYSTPTLEPTWIKPGTEQVLLRATVSKPGYESEQFEAYYTLTSGLGIMGEPRIKIEEPLAVSIKHLSNTTLQSTITGDKIPWEDPKLTIEYIWKEVIDGVRTPIEGETNPTYIARGNKVGSRIYTVEAKLTHPDYMVTRVFATKDVTVTTTPLSNTVGSNLEPGSKTVLIDEPVTLEYILDLSGVEAPISNIVYSWYVDDVLVEGAVGPNYTFSQSTMKQYKVSAKAEVIFIDTETYPSITRHNNATITVIPDVKLSIEASHPSLPVQSGEKFVLSPKITGIDLSNATVAYEWTHQDTKYTSENLELQWVKPGEDVYTLKVTISAPGYSARSFESSYTVVSGLGNINLETFKIEGLPTRKIPYGSELTLLTTASLKDLDIEDPDISVNYTWFTENDGIKTTIFNGPVSRFILIGSEVGKVKYGCTIEINHPNYNTFTIDSNIVEVETTMASISVLSELTPQNKTVFAADTVRFEHIIDFDSIEEPYDRAEYKWYVNDVQVPGSDAAYYDFTSQEEGDFRISSEATVYFQDSESFEPSVVTAAADLVVKANPAIGNTYSIEVTPSGDSMELGTTFTATAVPANAPLDELNVKYLWSTGETTQTITREASPVGSFTLTCTVTWEGTDYPTATFESSYGPVDVTKKPFPHDGKCTLRIELERQSGETTTEPLEPTQVIAGSTVDPVVSYRIYAILPSIPADSTSTYSWNGEQPVSDNYISGTCDPAGVTDVSKSVQVFVENAEYEIEPFFAETSFIIDNMVEPCPLITVHPLPWRSSAYIWSGWWVMDAIQKLTAEGKDWRAATHLDSPYHCHLAVLSKMLDDYPEVDVQESRNGRIVHRSALEVGIIYDYIY